MHIRRREFIVTLGGAAAWPLGARAQQPVVPVVGFLSPGSSQSDTGRMSAVRRGLEESGYVEARNVVIEYRGAEGQSVRLPALAADLVNRRVAVIVTVATPATLAAKAATATIPIIFNVGVDPVEAGLVTSLNRPGGNLTGVGILAVELGPKRLELLHELLPSVTSIAVLINPTSPGIAEPFVRAMQPASHTLGLQLHVLRASTERDFDTVFETLVQLRAGALVIMPDVFFTVRSEQLATRALRHAIPAIYPFREFASAGGLMSYGSSLTDAFRQIGVYTGRILKGERPADLPVQQSTKVNLIINLKTARALGITFPLTLLGRADEVIE